MTFTTQARYEVGMEKHGSVSGYCRNWKIASREALRLFEEGKTGKLLDPEVVYIYDRLARHGKPCLWHVENGNLIVKDTNP